MNKLDVNDLLGMLADAEDQIRELTRQRDDARDLAVRSGIFENLCDALIAEDRES